MKLNIIHLGMGNIGRKVVEQIINQQVWIKQEYGIELTYCGLFTSQKGIFNKDGISFSTYSDLVLELHQSQVAEDNEKNIKKAIELINYPFVLIDTTASDKTIAHICQAMRQNGFVVMANKKPLSHSQKQYDELQQVKGHVLYFETVVGAGLPVIQTIRTLRDTGDEILEIHGCLSGTLGYIFSQMERGKLFSETVYSAINKGFAEPDPRSDLSGMDVARKALILSRLCGWPSEFEKVRLAGLFPRYMNNLKSHEFLKLLPDLDAEYLQRSAIESKNNMHLRYVAEINRNTCEVGLQAVSKTSDMGSLKGTDNLFVIKTKRYFNNPLIIKGPGAGIDVTAAGVFGDILTIARRVKGVSHG